MVWHYLFAGDGVKCFDSQLLEYIKNKSNEQIESILRDVKNLYMATDSSGASLLHYAAECGNDNIAQVLIELGAKLDLQDKKGQTPLILATRGNHEETVRVLLKYDADIYISDNAGVSALQLAVQETFLLSAIVEMFLSQVQIDCSDSKEIAKRLLKVNCPLYVAVRLQNVDAVEQMLSKGTSIEVVDPKNNQTALHVAVQNQDVDMVRLLIDRGANVNALDNLKQTPLSLIKKFEETKILEILVNNKTELTTCTEDGFMQMYWVLTTGTCEAVKIVLQPGVDLGVKDSHERSVMHYLANNVNAGVVDTLKKVLSQEAERVALQARDLHERTVVHYLANIDNPGIVDTFTEWDRIDSFSSRVIERKSIDWNAKDRDGRTALHIAMAAGNASFIEYLIGKGAEVNVKTNDGVTAFFEALESSKSALEKRVECVKLIMENGAYPDIEIKHYLKIYNTKSAINRDFPLLEPVLAHLVLREAKGERISEKLLKAIDCHPQLKNYVAACKEELDYMKTEKIYRNINMFDFLAQTENKFVFELSIQFFLEDLVRKYKFNSYYSRVLRKRYAQYSGNFVDIYRLTILGCIALAVCALYFVNVEVHFDQHNFTGGVFVWIGLAGMALLFYTLPLITPLWSFIGFNILICSCIVFKYVLGY